MNREELTRRDFHRLTAAAMGGLMAGTFAGCGRKEGEPGAPGDPGHAGHEATPAGHAAAPDAEKYDVALLLEEPHVCRGLNTCMNLGKSGDNACAGQGDCHTVAEHGCHYDNECRGQGGCGEYPGQNTCRGQGECAVPLGDATWQKARAAFEKIWAERNPDKRLGQPPGA